MIAARRTIDHLRKSKFPAEPLEKRLGNLLDATPERSYDADQLQLLNNAVKDLAPHEKIIVDLFFLEGLPAKDVATILRMSVGAVYTQKSRILAKLRERLRKASEL